MKLQDASTQRGQATRVWARREIERLSGLAQRKHHPAPLGEVLMSDLNPPLLTDEERGQGDSVNARLHRLLRGR